MRVVVTGGAGRLGREVVAQLAGRGVSAVSASRRTGVDLATGEGLAAVLAGADAVVHCASSPLRARRVDLEGTRRLLGAATPGTHVVYISIVGCDANPYSYYRTKAACEDVLAASGTPVTVVRATQFHTLVAAIARAARPLGRGISVRGVAVQPCDLTWVAAVLAEVATGPAPGGFTRAADLAGPERLTLAEAVRAAAAHAGYPRTRVLTLPPVGSVARAFAAGSNLPGPDVRLGGSSFRRWLAGQPAYRESNRYPADS